uniref:C2H2-type domain-containing protein n=1 Tax=Nothobranchius furzeri TaxID=105023 RepID=A0A8C6K683_NOTFU
MSSAQSLREFIRERLTAAAAEIFSEFEQTIVRYEEEIDRQRRLLEISWKPQINVHRIELPQHHVWEKEEVLTDQQFCTKETSTSLDQKEPEPPLIKEEQQEHCIRQHEGSFILKQENLTIVKTSPDETDRCEPEPDRNKPLCQSSTEAENQDQDGHLNENSAPNSHDEPTQNKRRQQTKDHRNGVSCRKIKRHKTAPRDERPFKCKTCGNSFSSKGVLTVHLRTHTGEKPFRCNTCGKCFSQRNNLTTHMRTHTGEKPFRCNTCGKCFSQSNNLTDHIRTHTGEKPYLCKTCGKRFSAKSGLTSHIKNKHVKQNITK